MDLHRMISELQAERARLDEAILALERLSSSQPRRRGRPPEWLKELLGGHSEPAPQQQTPEGEQ